MRRFAIGDIHGCAKALRTVIETINPTRDDELVFIGDFIDRGPDSRDVVSQLLELERHCRVIALRGNHEIMLLGVALKGLDDAVWIDNGGLATIVSYGGSVSKIPDDHLDFFQRLRPYHENDGSIFVHAGYDPEVVMHQQTDLDLFWNHLAEPLPPPHHSGKRVFVGHTPQALGDVLDGGHIICIDTYCFGGGYLTAYDENSGELIQADRHGHLRRAPGSVLVQGLRHVRDRMAAYYRRQVESARVAREQQESQETPSSEGTLPFGNVSKDDFH